MKIRVLRGGVTQLPEQLERLLATLETLDRNDRIEMLVDVARRFRRVPERIAVRPYPKERRVPGCESEAYVWAESQCRWDPDLSLRGREPARDIRHGACNHFG